ncbi:MAG: hypothetical protein ACR2PH_15250, partial [Desulfobulbia bacterium]
LTAVLTSGQRPLLLGTVVCAAIAASIFMWWIPTESAASVRIEGENQSIERPGNAPETEISDTYIPD